MRNWTSWVGVLLLCQIVAYAQTPTQSILGEVVDKASQQPIIGATVLLVGGQEMKGTVTDIDGSFQLDEVPVGRVRVQVSYVGYQTLETEDMILSSAKPLQVRLAINEGIMLDGVEVLASGNVNAPINPFSVVSTRSFSVEETERIAASVNDMGRMALSFPGVQQGRDDTENDIIIRGNSSFGMLWRLEGIDIPNPNHFARPGTSGGGITVFSAQLLSRSDFSTGAMAAEYGNALSGAFDIHLRSGNKVDRDYRVKIGLLGLDFAAEGPFKQGESSYVVNYRYSTLGLLNKMGFHLIGERVSNDFQDLSFNLDLTGKNPRHKFTVFSLAGISLEHYTPVSDPTARDYGVANHWEDREQGSNMAVVGGTYTWLIDDQSYFKVVAAGMYSEIFRRYDTLSLNDERFRYNTQEYLDYRFSTAASYNRKFSDRWNFKTGLIAHQVVYDFFKETAPRTSVDDINVVQSELSVEGGGTTQSTQAYAQFTWQPTDRIDVNAGLHGMHLFLNNTSALDPRLSMQYRINQKHTTSLAFGQHSQWLPLAAYFFNEEQVIDGQTTTVLPNFNLKPIHSMHYVLGHHYVTPGKLKITVEVYLQQLRNVPVAPDADNDYWMLNNQNDFPEFAVVNEGTGLNYGVDFAIEKFFSNQIYFLITASRFESTYETYGGDRFNTRFGTKWVSSYTLGKEFNFKKARVLQVGGRVLLNGGFRYTPYDPVASQAAGVFVPLAGAQWSEQVNPYFRIDGRISYRYNRPKWSGVISLDVQNATSRKNTNSVAYNAETNETFFRQYPGGDFIPVLSFQFDF